MGRFNPYLLPDWYRDHGAALVDPDRSVQIGRERMASTPKATLVYDRNTTVVYGEEVELQSIRGYPLELPEEIEQMLGIKLLTGWLFYTEDRRYQGHDLVITETPARNLYFQGKLQPAIHRKKSEIIKELREAIRKSGQDDPIRALSEALSILPFQPFESRTTYLSAWLIEPRQTEGVSITQRTRGARIDRSDTVKSSLRGNFTPEAEWSMGICRDIDRCIRLLEIDEEKYRLFEKTENGDLFEHYRDSKSPQPGPVYRLMKAIAASLREDVYREAIMTALAGIDEDLYRSDLTDGVRPVIKQVKVLYHRLMYALVQRCKLSDPVLKHSELASSSPVSSPARVITLREKLEELSEKVQSFGQEVFLQAMAKAVAEATGPHETFVLFILAAPKKWPLPDAAVEWLRRYQPEFSKDIQKLIDRRLGPQ